MQGTLSKLRTWELNHKEEDIRGWPLRDAQEHVLGNVGELVVDTDSRHVTEIVLSDGRRYSAHDVIIGDRELRLGGNGFGVAETARRASGAAAVVEAAKEAAKSVKEKVEQKFEQKLEQKPARSVADPGDLTIPLVDEEVDIGKRRIEAGGMRVTARTVEKPFDRDLNLYEEHVDVERRRVDQPLTLAEANERLRDASIEVHAKAERAVVQKHAHVVEEVVLKKQALDRVERLSDSVRHTECEVAELSNGNPSRTQRRS